nr:T9SS type A sorting domain-containing protein [Bacteroidia bacterium]
GNLIWVHSATANTFDDACTGIAIDEWGNILVSGWFNGSFTLGITTLQSEGGYDLFVASFDTAGNALWAKSAGGADDDFAMAMTYEAGGAYTTGFFASPTCNFDAIAISDANAGFDMFVAKLIYLISSVPETESGIDILLFPNPANSHIKISTSLAGKISVKLFSQIGQCVYQSNVDAGDGIDVCGLAKGVYICEIKQNQILVNKKVIVN